MTNFSGLFGEFCDALNAELEVKGSRLRVDATRPGPDETMLLLDANGAPLGWLPDHVDAAGIAAFEPILARVRHDR